MQENHKGSKKSIRQLYRTAILLYRTTIYRSGMYYINDRNGAGTIMDVHIRKVYVPMTETGFYILLCLREEMHGYNIVQKVKDMTEGEILISPGTMYGTLSKMEKDNLIEFLREEDKRKIYQITRLGREVLSLEMNRIKRLYKNVEENEA